MSYPLLIAGLFFVFNPEFSYFDFLPDFIGLLMIARAISHLTEVSPSAENAAILFKKAAIASVVQCAFLFPMMSVTVTDPALHLVFTFVSHLARLIFLLPAFGDLFASIRYFSERHSKNVWALDAAQVLTALFLILRAFLTILPQSIYLKVEEFGIRYPLTADRTRWGMSTQQFLIRTCFPAALAIGLGWFILTTVFFLALRRNKELNQGLIADIAAAPRSIGKTVLRTTKPALYLLIFSAFAMIGYSIDGLPLFPPFLAPLLQVIAISMVTTVLNQRKKKLFFPIFAVILGLMHQLAMLMFCEMYHETAQYDFPSVQTYFKFPMVTKILFVISSFLALLRVRAVLKRLIHEHTGVFWENAYITHNARMGKEKVRQLFLLNTLTFLFAILLASNTFSYYHLYLHPAYRLINVGIGLVIAGIAAGLYGSVLASIKEKYSDEMHKNQ